MTAVEYQVKRLLKGEPQEDKLKGLAARCYPGVARVLTAGPTAVEDTLRATFDLPPLKRKLSPGELVVVSACIVGSLLANPEEEFPELRDYDSEWWKINAQTIRGIGGPA